ncbi:MAG: phosphate ABC transporter permease subunit PstC [Candidatus Fermentithermobacillus carboniphilus]|uniref:Phosphate transport system permease protein n=1 Tax=Candidatus Fermentithermobacillus carboniphilus TaxID=3085328 RepID=A0AAT9LEI4_9FIRM|nr:MAG: phosphate ABC transporter permease subunit PstC [Candidatus Fermentithermobacillus carboniphilus]
MKRQRLSTKEAMARFLALCCVTVVIVATFSLLFFITRKGISTFTDFGVRLLEFLTGRVWRPDRLPEEGGPAIGVVPFLVGSFTVSGLAVLIAGPLGIATAIFMAEVSPVWGEKIMRPVVEILVGIPSVVYGWIGLSVLVPLVRQYLGGLGFSLLSAGLVLSVMILPTVTSLSCDALKSLPRDLKEAAYALGCTRWQVIRGVLVPAALPGILTGLILGMARAFGEALAVQMVIGNVYSMPRSLLSPGITLTTGLTMEMGNTIDGSLWNSALWSMALVLLLFSLGFIGLVRLVSRAGGYRT